MGAGQENYYLALAQSNYYLEGGERPGAWLGSGAEALGIAGEVERGQLKALIRGQHPDGTWLVQRQTYSDGRERCPGWDLTFSAPKSVSVLFAVGDHEIRDGVRNAHEQAVKAALTYLEQEAGVSRRGKNGAEHIPAEFIVASFEHCSSRAQDPQLHTHCLVLNAALRADGTKGALYTQPLYQHKMAAGAVYRAELARALHGTLGLRLTASEYGFELHGVPSRVTNHFSKRRAEIDAAIGKFGWKSPRVAELAALSTRSAKERAPQANLHAHWRLQARELGFSSKSASSLLGRARPWKHLEIPELVAESVRECARELAEKEGQFYERDLLARALDHLARFGVGAPEVVSAVKGQLQSADYILSVISNDRGKPLYTTRELRASEQRVLGWAQLLRERHAHEVRPRWEREAKDALSDKQKEAYKKLTAESSDLVLLSARNSAARSMVLRAAREQWETAGHEVIGVGESPDTAAALGETTGIKSSSVARLRAQLEEQWRRPWRTGKSQPWLTWRSVIVVDDAQSLSTESAEWLFHLAWSRGAKLVLAGHRSGLSSARAGGVFQSLASRHSDSVAHVSGTRRTFADEAAAELSLGDARGALSILADHGRVSIKADVQDARDALIREWNARRLRGSSVLSSSRTLSEGLVEKLDAHLGATIRRIMILASDQRDVSILNEKAQTERLRRGELGISKLLLSRKRFHVLDRVVLNKNTGRGLRGEFGTIEGLDPIDGIATVRLDRTERRGLVQRHVRATVNLRKGEADLGYATTSGTGRIFEETFVLLGGMNQTRELSYTQLTRSRSPHVFTTSADAGEDVEELVRTMNRTEDKQFALDLEARGGLQP